MLLNCQHRVPVSIRSLEAFLARVRRKLSLPKESLCVCFVSDAEMARWNRAYRGKNGPTDVLSFPMNGQTRNGKQRRQGTQRKQRNKITSRAQASPIVSSTSAVSFTSSTSSAPYFGDVAISPHAARKNAIRFGRSLDDELRILILHGVLHLLGYDHETDNGRMDRREQRLRRELGLS